MPRETRAGEGTICVYACLAAGTFSALVDVDTGGVICWVQPEAVVTEAVCCVVTVCDSAAVLAACGATELGGVGIRLTAACGRAKEDYAKILQILKGVDAD